MIVSADVKRKLSNQIVIVDNLLRHIPTIYRMRRSNQTQVCVAHLQVYGKGISD
jgi:hypothetical protein